MQIQLMRPDPLVLSTDQKDEFSGRPAHLFRLLVLQNGLTVQTTDITNLHSTDHGESLDASQTARGKIRDVRVKLNPLGFKNLIKSKNGTGYQADFSGWEVDSATHNYKKGTRPQKGRNLAIAEWPTASGPADYVLFAGLTPLAVVEAKRAIKDVPGSIGQAKRYNRQTAYRETTNQDIAATIIGYIRFVANGSPLLPYKDRVAQAVRTILASRSWTAPCRKSVS